MQRKSHSDANQIEFKGNRGPWIAIVNKTTNYGNDEDFCSNTDEDIAQSELEAFEYVNALDLLDYKEFDLFQLAIMPYSGFHNNIVYEDEKYFIGTSFGGVPREMLNKCQETLFDYTPFYDFKLMAAAPELFDIAKNALVFIEKFRSTIEKKSEFNLEALFEECFDEASIYSTLIRATEFNKQTSL